MLNSLLTVINDSDTDIAQEAVSLIVEIDVVWFAEYYSHNRIVLPKQVFRTCLVEFGNIIDKDGVGLDVSTLFWGMILDDILVIKDDVIKEVVGEILLTKEIQGHNLERFVRNEGMLFLDDGLLLNLLNARDYKIRKAAVMSVSEKCDSSCLPNLQAMLSDSNADVRKSAIFAIRNVGGEKEVECLLPYLKDQDVDVCLMAMRVLADIGGASVFNHISSKLGDGDFRIRSGAIEALGEISGEDVIGTLLPKLKDSHPLVRCSALSVLGQIGHKSVFRHLLEMLKDCDAEVRAVAVKAIGKVRGFDVVENLRVMLSDSSSLVRQAAVSVITKIGGESEIKSLIPLLQDENDIVRCHTIDCVTAIDGSCPDYIRSIFTEDLDSHYPWLDVKHPMLRSHLVKASNEFHMEIDDIVEDLRFIYSRYGLELEINKLL